MAAPASSTRSRTVRRSGAVTLAVLVSLLARPTHASCPSSCPAPAVWTQPFSFAGLTWERKSGCGGPGPNCWVPGNAEPVAGDGIHMRLTRASGKWYAGEIRTTAPVGYGDYSVQLVGRTDLLDANVVLGIFLYDDEGAEAGEVCPAELDMESSRFGEPLAPNGHGVVYVPGLCGPADLYDFRYSLNGTYTTDQLSWGPGVAYLRWLHGHRCAPETPDQIIAERFFSSPLVPAAGRMRLHINLWAFAGNAPTDQQPVEVVIRDIVTTCQVAAAGPAPRGGAAALAVRPNPSAGETEIGFELPGEGQAQVTIVDVTGRRVATLADAVFPAGRHMVRWRPGVRVAGVYFARLTIGSRVVTQRMILLR